MTRREIGKRAGRSPLPVWLLAIAMVLSGCSLLGDDGDTNAGLDSGSTTTSTAAGQGNGTAAAPDADTGSGTTLAATTTSAATTGSSSEVEPEPDETAGPEFNDGFCDAPQRNQFDVRFDPGASSSVIDSATIAGQVDLYRIEVGDGQIMVITLGSDDADAVATLYQPNGSVLPGAFVDTSVAPTQAGAYWICVTAGGSGADYQLSVSVITDNTPTKVDAPWCGSAVNDRGEIQFESGRFTGQVEDAVIRGERDLYRFTAGEGQALDLFLVSPEFNAVFDLRSPSGEILMDEVSDFRIPLPESGTYEICVGASRGNTSYVLDIAIG
jgi:hypothetical protein